MSFLDSYLPDLFHPSPLAPAGAVAPVPAPPAPDRVPVSLPPTGLAPEARPVDPEKMRRVASTLFEKMDGVIQDEKGVLVELRSLSPAELAAVKAQYREQENGRDLDADVQKAMDSAGQHAEAAALLDGGDPERRVKAAEAALTSATHDGLLGTGLTTDHDKIHDTLAGLSPAEMEAL
jgi:hypothetical protein